MKLVTFHTLVLQKIPQLNLRLAALVSSFSGNLYQVRVVGYNGAFHFFTGKLIYNHEPLLC